jgi:hypothetical protein
MPDREIRARDQGGHDGLRSGRWLMLLQSPRRSTCPSWAGFVLIGMLLDAQPQTPAAKMLNLSLEAVKTRVVGSWHSPLRLADPPWILWMRTSFSGGSPYP